MYYEATSNSIGTSSEITAIMPIKSGTIDHLDTTTYATRLRQLLRTYNGLRKTAYESRSVRVFAGATEMLQTLYSVRWMIINQDQQLLLSVNFDSAWEPYIRRIVGVAGPVLDSILCHCDGYDRFNTELGYHKFAEWVRNHQNECDFFYSATPNITVDDLAYLSLLEKRQRELPPSEFDEFAAAMVVPDLEKAAKASAKRYPVEEIEQGLRALAAFHRLAPKFGNPDHGRYLWRAASVSLNHFDFLDRVPKKLRKRYADAIGWAEKTQPPKSTAKPKAARLSAIKGSVQGNVVGAYRQKTHGALLLVQLDPANATEFLNGLELTGEVASETGEKKPTTNIAFTFDGLRRMGLSREILEQFPNEFRDGMEARAGLLGDVGANHPDQWQRPQLLLGYDETTDMPIEGPRMQLRSVDLIVMLQVHAPPKEGDHQWSRQHPLFEHVQQLFDGGENGPLARLLTVQPLRRQFVDSEKFPNPEWVRDHFGLVDGISNPRMTDKPTKGSDIPVGDIVLGEPNSSDDPNADLQDRNLARDVLLNGTFMVVRKLEQNVPAFEDFVAANAGSAVDELSADQIKSKMIGRRSDGTPLVEHASVTDFDYNNDPRGEACPFQAHMRRANPRKGDTRFESPQIMRRGFMYGPPTEIESNDERGLVFMALNANLAEQFEVIQRWCAQGNSTSVYSGHADPILGVAYPGEARIFRFADISDRDGNRRVHRLDMNMGGHGSDAVQFVTLKWGLYTFVPSLEAFEVLKRTAGESMVDGSIRTAASKSVKAENVTADVDALNPRFRKPHAKGRPPLEEGRGVVGKLRRLPKSDPGNEQAWRIALEDLSAKGAGITESIWEAVKEDGAVATKYGLLVANPDDVKTVLSDNGTQYSARTYWHRLESSGVGGGYVGMDVQPTEIPGDDEDNLRYQAKVSVGDYARDAKAFNGVIAAIGEEASFRAALERTQEYLLEQRRTPDVGREIDVPLKALADYVVGALAHYWFGLPIAKEGVEMTETVNKFRALVRYIFNPTPSDYLRDQAQKAGKALKKQGVGYAQELVKRNGVAPTSAKKAGNGQPVEGRIFDHLLSSQRSSGRSAEEFASLLVGTAQGFVGPTRGSFLSVMSTLVQTGELWAIQASLLTFGNPLEFASANRAIRATLESAMRYRPVPEVVHRTAVRPNDIGGQKFPAGQKIVASLRPASAQSIDFLFGGKYDDGKPHACPGKQMAMGTLLGMITGIVSSGTIVPGPNPVIVTLVED